MPAAAMRFPKNIVWIHKVTCVDEESSLFQNPTAASGERPRCGAIAGEGLSRWTVSQRHNCWETPVPRAAQRSAAAQPPRPLRAPARAAAGARSRWRYGQPGRVGLRGEGTSPGTRVALEAPRLVCWSAETGCSTGGSGSASLAQSPPAVAAGEGAGCIAQHRRERSPRRSAQQTGSAEGWGRTSPRCKMLLAAASGPLRPSVSSTPSPTLRPGAALPPRDTQRPVKELGALPNQQAVNDATCSPYLTEAHLGRTSPTPLQKKTPSALFSKRPWRFAQTSQLNCRTPPKTSAPPLNIPAVLPSFPVSFCALLSTCRSPRCKQEHFSVAGKKVSVPDPLRTDQPAQLLLSTSLCV